MDDHKRQRRNQAGLDARNFARDSHAYHNDRYDRRNQRSCDSSPRSRSRSRSPARKRRRSNSPDEGRRRSHHNARPGDRDHRSKTASLNHRLRSLSRSLSPKYRQRRRQSLSRSRSPDRTRRKQPHSPSRSPPPRRSRKPLPSQADIYQGDEKSPGDEAPPKEKPSLKPTGLLAAEANRVTFGHSKGGKPDQSIVLKYHEPPEARKPPPKEPWILYCFKGETKDPILTVHLQSRSCWLFGRESAVVDVPIEHPSCSKQHAVLQFRHREKTNEYGEKKGRVGLYLIDLESANSTYLNRNVVGPARYVEVKSGDVVKFGESTREYVVLLPPKG